MIGWGKGWLTEAGKIVNITPPQDVTGAATTSLYVNFKNNRRCTFVVITGAIAAGETAMAFTLQQAKDNAGTGAKALSFDTAYKAVGQAQTDGTDNLVAVTVASDTFNIANTDDNGVFCVNVRDDMLDINNAFTHVCVKLTSPGANSTLIAILAIMYDADNSGSETTLPSVVA